jgi:hypothetical protein
MNQNTSPEVRPCTALIVESADIEGIDDSDASIPIRLQIARDKSESPLVDSCGLTFEGGKYFCTDSLSQECVLRRAFR